MQLISAFLNKDHITKTEPLWQYDSGVMLEIACLDGLEDEYQVHFATDPEGDSVSAEGTALGAQVPDSLLAEGVDIYAYVYATDQDGGSTLGCIQIPVRKRAKLPVTPEEPEPEPAEEPSEEPSEQPEE